MFGKQIVKKILFFSLFLALFFVMYVKFFKKNEIVETEVQTSTDTLYNSNIIENVNYVSKDNDGNEYIINAYQGEIDYSNSNIIYLTNVKALIKLNNSENITITSNYGKYNSENYDTIFSKNVIINYMDNKITGEYLDFSLERNSLIISRDIIYTNLENILKADVLEMDIKTKDTKIFMYEDTKKVNIRNKDSYGNN
ncbi:LPS export ABC transporter periplasmic protein LptC [Candidatus Pelagibacter sp. FZCC0015]|uniref:LPS export ABC transporter periplasmic protein LptC n=1 Tax=Candidatus Pelagibacter sp. FZCC0015 TaxID=2268451 RepID=UPI0011A21142|nr:LPS export ABC transporter periplasmic protein LptC [Candidatus Pelagibacter sp. FZCC0015]